MARRISPLDPNEIDRVTERLFNAKSDQIKDRDSFDRSFLDFVDQASYESQDQKEFASKVFDKLRSKHPSIDERRLFTKAGGKDLQRDKRRTAKTIAKTPAEFIKKGAKRTDFRGIDTKPITFPFNGLSKGKVVQARKINITFKGKKQVRFIDRRGRYVKVQK